MHVRSLYTRNGSKLTYPLRLTLLSEGQTFLCSCVEVSTDIQVYPARDKGIPIPIVVPSPYFLPRAKERDVVLPIRILCTWC